MSETIHLYLGSNSCFIRIETQNIVNKLREIPESAFLLVVKWDLPLVFRKIITFSCQDLLALFHDEVWWKIPHFNYSFTSFGQTDPFQKICQKM